MSFFREVFKEGTAGGPAREDKTAGHPSAAVAEMSARLTFLQRPHVLDLGPVCDKNIEYFASRGCRVFVEAAEDMRRLGVSHAASKEQAEKASKLRGGEAVETPPPPAIALGYPESHFDGVLLWDVMDYLPDDLASLLGRELDRITRRAALVVLFSDARRSSPPEPLVRYRLNKDGVLKAEAVPGAALRRVYRENRDLFRLFPGFEVVKSTLLPNQLREILLRRRP